ncbi:MAG: thioredoxin family protein [Gemmatimonadales bacterium]|jgi:thiol:disulfide interchange protein
MRITALLSALTVVGIASPAGVLTGQEAEVGDPIYIVPEYDPNRDPAADLETAIQRAGSEGKRILLEVGGTWCIDCVVLDLFVAENAAVAQKLRESFVVLKVNVGPENQNRAFLARYPKIQWYPHIFVLESDGTFLYSLDTRELHDGRMLGEKLFIQFLDKWAPP